MPAEPASRPAVVEEPLAHRLNGTPTADHAQLPMVFAQGDENDPVADPVTEVRWRKPQASKANRSPMMLLAGAAGLCLLVFLLWHFTGGGSTGNEAPAGVANAAGFPASAPAPVMPKPSASRGLAVAPSSSAAPAPASVSASIVPQRGQVWRVVAYTYNAETQAKAKARLIAEQHADLDPQVYSRTGHAPFLVTLGGALSEQAAATMRQRARSLGLARDVYMQNYSR